MPAQSLTETYTGSVFVSPFWTFVPSLGWYQTKMLVGIHQSDVGAAAEVEIDHLGAARTYKGMGSYLTNCDIQNRSGVGILMWWSD